MLVSSGFRFVTNGFVVLAAVTLASCGADSTDPADESAQTAEEGLRALTGYPVKVFFSKSPDSFSTFDAVFPVQRVSPTLGVATYALQLLIAGPTRTEFENGYFSELNSILTGPSDCSAPLPTGGPDFKLALNKKGAVTEIGTATVRFCRATQSPGTGADARIVTEIDATLKQFSTITKVIILTKDGHCFADGTGDDVCLQ
jgi:hypothetical protein